MTITPELVKIARTLLGCSRDELAGRVGVREQQSPLLKTAHDGPRVSIFPTLRATLGLAGIEFISEDGIATRSKAAANRPIDEPSDCG